MKYPTGRVDRDPVKIREAQPQGLFVLVLGLLVYFSVYLKYTDIELVDLSITPGGI